MTKLTELTIAAARDGLQAKQFTATELVDAHIKVVEATRPAEYLHHRNAGAGARGGERI